MFKVGQKVWCLIFGQGVVAEVDDEDSLGSYCIDVKFKDDLSVSYTSDGKIYAEGNISLFPHPVEVIKATTKPSIDWSHVNEEFQYLAMNKDGMHLLFAEEPTKGDVEWTAPAPYELYLLAEHFTSFTPGTCDWRDSLVKRPS